MPPAAPPLSSRFAAALALVAAVAGLGCWARYPFPVAELKNLHGYDVAKERDVSTAPVASVFVGTWPYGPVYTPYSPTMVPESLGSRPFRVVSVEGEPMDFSSDTALTFYLKDGRTFESTFRNIRVAGERFVGATLKGDHKVDIPLAAIRAVTLRRPDSTSTLLVTLAIVGGAVLLVSLAVVAGGG